MYLRLGSVPCVVISTAAAAREFVLKNDADTAGRPQVVALAILEEDKTVASANPGPYWNQLRKLCHDQLFSPKRLASYENARTEEIHHMARLLREDAKRGEVIDVRRWLQGVTCNYVTRMLLGKRYFGNGEESPEEKEEKQGFEKFYKRIFEAVGTFIIDDYVPYLSFITKLQGWIPRLWDIRHFSDSISVKIADLDKHRQRALDRNRGEEYVPDFVDVLLTTKMENGEPLPDKNIKMVLMNMLIAGTDTMANTVEWAMAELMVNPLHMKRAKDELDNVVGTNRLVQESDIPNLPFLQAITKEALRMHPPAPLSLPHESIRPAEIMGYKFPAHTRVFYNLFAIHRDPAMYEKPDEFNPQRFIDHPEVNHLTGMDYYELIPFGAGRRMCPAYQLGNLMVSLMLAHVLHSFDWLFPEGESVQTFDMSEEFKLTVALKNPPRWIFQPRNPAFLY
ncbi:cytochrome P450 703A2 isoform X2 [Physcomitrium patens]|nr:cytochrome P450 703A2-like isoform X2 [Physcomitrium patens]|eukprot:XP_024380069.1 cytochrome P450 703A2-like isoform X2 [Physcomitrella patens]